MKRIAVVLASLFALPAHAEVTKLGDFRLGGPATKAGFVKSATAFGCTGSLHQSVEKGKTTGAELRVDRGCKPAAVEALLEKEYGAKPIISVDKTAKLWEGKTGSMMVITERTGSVSIRLLQPGPGAQRPCFADDGFAAFWKSFKESIDKPDAVAKSFKFPLKDFDDTVKVKDAKTLSKKWSSMIDDADKKEIASGSLTPTCSIGVGAYDLSLSESNLSLEARQVGGKWMWVEINDQASG